MGGMLSRAIFQAAAGLAQRSPSITGRRRPFRLPQQYTLP